ncbi:uncharacterized protein LOC134276849 [Saccostrea cucullata]|uniref:uncharacterized protein LOC134276849 n=1 Tax=Saccostrea cuccullata TaxID=36930 RepID=UPI002ED03658
MDPNTSSQDVIRCAQCETAVVQMHCVACIVNLCKACVGEHISDESKDHKVVKFQSRKTTPLYPRCTFHETERCEMYCRHCDIPVCLTCLHSDQHRSHKLSRIQQVLNEKKNFMKKELSELNETIYPTYQGIAAHVKIKMSQLEKEYEDISTVITNHGIYWHRNIDKIVNKLKTEVNEMKISQLQTLQQYFDNIYKKIVGIKSEIDSLDTCFAENTNDIARFFNLRPKVNQYKELPQNLVLFIPKFNPKTIQDEKFIHQFGGLSSIPFTTEDARIQTTQTSTQCGSSLLKKKFGSHLPRKQFNTDMFHFENYLQNIAYLSNEKIWICVFSNIIELYDTKRHLYTKTIRTKSGSVPADIAVTCSGYLIYTDDVYKTVDIVKNEKVVEMIRFKNWKPRNVCSTSFGDLLLTMESDEKQSKVFRYSGITEKQSFQFDDKGNPLYTYGEFKDICENRNFDICVADSKAKAIVVVNKAGKLRFSYIGHTPAPKNKPFSPRGITTDIQGHILTTDYDNKSVHIMDQDGQFLHYINCGKNYPYGICKDTVGNLFALCNDGFCKGYCVMKIKYMW